MSAQVTKLFSSSRRTVCTPCLPFLRKIEIFKRITCKFRNFDFSQKLQTRYANCAPWWAEQLCHLGQHQFYFPKLDKVLMSKVLVRFDQRHDFSDIHILKSIFDVDFVDEMKNWKNHLVRHCLSYKMVFLKCRIVFQNKFYKNTAGFFLNNLIFTTSFCAKTLQKMVWNIKTGDSRVFKQ